LHVALGPDAGLADLSAATMHSAYGMQAAQARELAMGGPPAQVAEQLARYTAAGADLLALACDPMPSARSWELAAEVRQLLNSP
jgi:alkanesulfonate monooxygenase SsuD/methylene tetrahydromethanopterin reductase-like flavin-dependent oxidoreductase (luciferase family)